MPIILSDPAIKEIASIIKEQQLDPDIIRLRVGVKGGGCSGFSYLLDLSEKQRETDESWIYSAPLQNGQGEDDASEVSITVICDPKSYLYLNGTTIDFKDEGIASRGFVFENPNATSSCGCGSSFSA